MVVISLNMLDPVLDAMEVPQPEPPRRRREELHLVNPHPDCLGEITSEYPFLQERYEAFRDAMTEPARIDPIDDAAYRSRCSAKPARPTKSIPAKNFMPGSAACSRSTAAISP